MATGRSTLAAARAALAALALTASLHCAPALERTADAVADAAGAAAVTHGVMEATVENPVTPLTSILYNCIALEAGRYAGHGADTPIEVPPQVERLVAGPARRSGAGLSAAGRTLSAAPPGRIVTLVGSDFGPLRDQNIVKVLGRPAPVSALCSRGVLTTILPFPAERREVRTEVQAIVRGVPSRALPLTLERETRAPDAPFILAKRVLAKQYAFAAAVAAAGWETPGGAAVGAERRATTAKLRLCAQDLAVELKGFDTLLNSNARFLEVHEMVLHHSPEVEQLLDRALARLPTAEPEASGAR